MTSEFQTLQNSCDVSVSQLPKPCLMGNALAVNILENEYKVDLAAYKNNLHDRLIIAKEDSPIRVQDLRIKLKNLWKPLGTWSFMLPLISSFNYTYICFTKD